MQNLEVQFTASAYEDLDRITDYLIERDLNAAQSTYDRLIAAVKHLSKFPLMGVMMEEYELRAWGHRKFIVDDFAVIYRIFDDAVVIYHIFNQRQDYGKIFDK